MIYGIGTDIVQMKRIEAALDRHGDRFAEKILHPDELEIFQSRRSLSLPRGTRFLATRFAAKEAFSKAIGTGIQSPMSWHAMQVFSGATGQPSIVTNGILQTWMRENHLIARVSLSDEVAYALAFVIVETTNESNL
jgi:holo-[acyl-carrier protein] synthase